MLAPLHLAPHVLGPDTGRRPQNGEVIEEIGALPDYRRGIAIDGIDHDFDGFFGQFLGHLGRAALEQPCSSRRGRIKILGRDDCEIKPFERITHPLKLIQTRGQRVNGRLPIVTKQKKSAGHSKAAGGLSGSGWPRLPAAVRMTVEIGDAGPAITISTAIIRLTAVIGIPAVIGRTATVIGRGAPVVIVVATVLRGGNRNPGADNAGKGGCRGGATAATIIATPGAEVSGVAGPGRRR